MSVLSIVFNILRAFLMSKTDMVLARLEAVGRRLEAMDPCDAQWLRSEE